MIAVGRSNWLFAGSLRAGQRAAAIMSLIQSARLNAHDPYACLKDVLMRLPTQKNSHISELLPHRWQPAQAPPLATMTALNSRCIARRLLRGRTRVRQLLT